MSDSDPNPPKPLGPEDPSNQADLDLAKQLVTEAEGSSRGLESYGLFQRAIEIQERTLGTNHLLIAETLEKFAAKMDDTLYYDPFAPVGLKEGLEEEIRELYSRAWGTPSLNAAAVVVSILMRT